MTETSLILSNTLISTRILYLDAFSEKIVDVAKIVEKIVYKTEIKVVKVPKEVFVERIVEVERDDYVTWGTHC